MVGSAYLALKLVHIASASVFFTMFLLGPMLKIAADRSRDPRVVAFVQDKWWRHSPFVIAFSGLLVFASGYVMVRGFLGRIAENPFSLWGLIVFFLALAVWYFGMRPLEARMANLADEAREAATEPGDAYRSASGAWLMVDGVIVLLVLVAFWLMVFQPRLWPG